MLSFARPEYVDTLDSGSAFGPWWAHSVSEVLLKLALIQVLDLSDRQQPDIVPVFGDELFDKLSCRTQTVQHECMYVAENALLLESVDDAAQRAGIEVVFGQSFIHALSTPAYTAAIEGSIERYYGGSDGRQVEVSKSLGRLVDDVVQSFGGWRKRAKGCHS
jgi:hypothetical protein